MLDTLNCQAYCLFMPATQTAPEYAYTIRTVCLSGARPWCAIVKGERWPSEGRSGRYPSEGMVLAAGRRMAERDAAIMGVTAKY